MDLPTASQVVERGCDDECIGENEYQHKKTSPNGPTLRRKASTAVIMPTTTRADANTPPSTPSCLCS